MAGQPLTEEHKEVRDILNRWRKASVIHRLLFGILGHLYARKKFVKKLTLEE